MSDLPVKKLKETLEVVLRTCLAMERSITSQETKSPQALQAHQSICAHDHSLDKDKICADSVTVGMADGTASLLTAEKSAIICSGDSAASPCIRAWHPSVPAERLVRETGSDEIVA